MKICIFFLLIFCATSLSAQRLKSFTVAFYNVENLFDTIDSRGINDAEFTPEGNYRWNTARYFDKLNKISEVLTTIEPRFPHIVGLCEIENRAVLEDLIGNERIKDAGYSIVHEDSPDPRGIDVALLYRSCCFKSIYHRAIPVYLNDEGQRAVRTRDILYVKGIVKPKDTLHIFVNHWSSRRGGEAQSAHKRIAAALTLRHAVDSLFSLNNNAQIIIMGDFNDNPDNTSIAQTLNAGHYTPEMPHNKLINLHLNPFLNGEGTLVFNQNWFLFDQIIVSKAFTKKKRRGLFLDDLNGQILKSDFLLHINSNGQASPNRTYVGRNYTGGYSDHLPIYIKFRKK